MDMRQHAAATEDWRRLGGVLVLVLLLATTAALAADRSAADPSVAAIAKQVDARYNRLRSFTADFTESYRGLGVVRNERGKLWLKKPGKMRWEYREPREKLFLTDGTTAYFYVAGDQQARRAPLKQLDDLRSPLRYLLGKSKLQKEFDGLGPAPGVAPLAAGDVVLRGVPRTMADRVNEVVLEIAPDGRIVRILVAEVDGSTTDFRFTNLVEDPQVADSQFRFTAPPGVQIVDSAEVAP
jgi:outer membrane lipoprotein carrier protein